MHGAVTRQAAARRRALSTLTLYLNPYRHLPPARDISFSLPRGMAWRRRAVDTSGSGARAYVRAALRGAAAPARAAPGGGRRKTALLKASRYLAALSMLRVDDDRFLWRSGWIAAPDRTTVPTRRRGVTTWRAGARVGARHGKRCT